MLTRITISNYLLIESLELAWAEGLTTITGETGSGKSILIGALELAMGGRADAGLLRDPSKRCVIELELDVSDLPVTDWFTANEIPQESLTILRRQLDPGGRSRAFVNDTPVRLEQLRELGSRLVHVHSQHQTLLLNDARFQLGLVDQLAGHAAEVDDLSRKFRSWRELQAELLGLRDEEQRAQAELDFLRFQRTELEEAGLKEGEQGAIEADLQRAEHAGERLEAYGAVEEGVAGDRGALGALTKVKALLAKVAGVDPMIASMLERINSCAIELKDIGAEASLAAVNVESDPARMDLLRGRLDLLLRLQQKHRVRTTEELIELLGSLQARTQHMGSLNDRIAALQEQENASASEYDQLAKRISKARTKAVKPLANKVEAILQQLGMPHAVFQFDHRTGEPGPFGIDHIRALFTANKDRAPAPLDKVASGGELSRVMLSLISLAAGSKDLPIVVFDEIDAGVSGEVADRVGSLLAAMGKERQVITITHLPQIASKAAHHLEVSKTSEGERVRTHIAPLDHEQRVQAIARMLSGRKLTAEAVDNARVLLSQQ
ncbi:MAG: DNA repair protein RecN [Flavobacteriales bacterium]|nr:DNA repair protein RecN [Flavobacteriales bacterium]MCC6938122.1 DNA repair protein RecN [Flavobacteriales bacterium]